MVVSSNACVAASSASLTIPGARRLTIGESMVGLGISAFLLPGEHIEAPSKSFFSVFQLENPGP
jgi:hypothetical protein